MSVQGALHQVSPWSPVESARTLALGAAGVVIVGVAWYATRGEASLRAQIPWVVVATAGFVVGSFGAVSWLLRARAAILHRREQLLPFPARADDHVPAVEPGFHVVVGPRPGKYHRLTCPLAVGRGWSTVDLSDAVAEQREPCGVCAP